MAEEANAGEPPKVNPLAKPVTMGAQVPKPGATVSTLKTGLKLPPKPGATVTALKPGLKLPPKPGMTATALKPGLKLPPKPGATVTALKPGLKLPPKPGTTATALKPGLKLPPKPVIRKPGSTITAAPLPKPIVPGTVPPPVATAATPASAPAPTPAPAPKPTPVPVDAQGVGKLPTVEAQNISRADVAANPVVPEMPKPMEALKHVTQKLKEITQPLPQQAILHKTGIVADIPSVQTEVQKEAAKHKTARIALSDAMGIAPVKNENAPMKTIRIKRPVGLPGAATVSALRPTVSAAPIPPAAPAASEAATEGAAPATEKPATATASVSMTQRKTLKISRPGGVVRPSGKFAVKRPGATVTNAATVISADAPKPAEGEVADIPDLPPVPPMPQPSAPVDTTPAWLATLSCIIQAAACVAMGVLAWYLYENTQTLYF